MFIIKTRAGLKVTMFMRLSDTGGELACYFMQTQPPHQAPKVANNSEQQAPKRARDAVFGLMMSALQKNSCAASLLQLSEEETQSLKGSRY